MKKHFISAKYVEIISGDSRKAAQILRDAGIKSPGKICNMIMLYPTTDKTKVDQILTANQDKF